ncbi:hypothetical protein VPH35_131033 [Triticum aestivum]
MVCWGSTLKSWSWTIWDLLSHVLGIFVVARLWFYVLRREALLLMLLLLESSLYLLRLCNDRMMLFVCVILDSLPTACNPAIGTSNAMVIKNCLLLFLAIISAY